MVRLVSIVLVALPLAAVGFHNFYTYAPTGWGCDGVIGSQVQFDCCGICNGTGATCAACDGTSGVQNLTDGSWDCSAFTQRLDSCGVCGGNNSCDTTPAILTAPASTPRCDQYRLSECSDTFAVCWQNSRSCNCVSTVIECGTNASCSTAMYEDFARAQYCGKYAATDVTACDTVAATLCHADYSRCVLDPSIGAPSSCKCYEAAAACIERSGCSFVVDLAAVAEPCCRAFTSDTSMGAKRCSRTAGCHWDGHECCAQAERDAHGLGLCLPSADPSGSPACEPRGCACTEADASVLAQPSQASAASGGFATLSRPCQRCLVEANPPDGGLACFGRNAPPLPQSLVAQVTPAKGGAVCTAADAALVAAVDDSIAPIVPDLSAPCQRCIETAVGMSDVLIAPRCLAARTLDELRRGIAYREVDRLLLSAPCQPIVRYAAARAPTCLSDGARKCHAHCLGAPLPAVDARRCSQWTACGWYQGCARAFDSSSCSNPEAEAAALATACSTAGAGCTGECWVGFSTRYSRCIKPSESSLAGGSKARVREIVASCTIGAVGRSTIVRDATRALPSCWSC